MVRLCNYLEDGANWQAQAILAYLKSRYEYTLEDTWNENYPFEYGAFYHVTLYNNGREHGYTIYVVYKNEQLNIAFYEHRNSDNICVISNNEYTCLEPPTSIQMYDHMKDKWDTEKEFKYGSIIECGDYIVDKIRNFINSVKESKKNEE